MTRWRLAGDEEHGLRLEPTRRFGDERFTWVDLLYFRLAEVRVYVLYFPSRFGLDVDRICLKLLHTFGDSTPATTSVNSWDPRDEHFAEALSLFGLQAPPAVVLACGLERSRDGAFDERHVYSITFNDRGVLGDTARLVAAMNLAHEVLSRGDPREITRLIRSRDREGLLASVARVAAAVGDQVVKLRPRLGLPGGLSISLGG